MSSDDDMGFNFDDSPQSTHSNKPTSPVADNDSFEDFEMKQSENNRTEMIKRYKELKEESKNIDNCAIQIKSLMLICRQMEQCYHKRIVGNSTLRNDIELRYLFDGSALLIVTIRNVSDQVMEGWSIVMNWEPVNIDADFTKTSQTIKLDNLPPGSSKSFEVKQSLEDLDLPIVVHFTLMRPFEMEDISNIFRVELDPICFTYWSLVQLSKNTSKIVSTSFEYAFRLPHTLIDLLCGCPDTVSPVNLFRAILPSSVSEDLDLARNEIDLIVPMKLDKWQAVKLKVQKESTYYTLTVCTENSYKLLKTHMMTMLAVEMTKLKSRPENSMEVLPELDEIEHLFESMIASFS